MASASKERLLLDGLLAQQMGWVSRQQVLESLRQWSESAPQPLGNLLGRGGLLTPAQRTLLDKLTREHLKKHGDDAARSLAELGEACGLVAELREVLSKVAPTAATYETRGPSDPYATKVGPTPGTAASGAVGPAPAIPLPPSPATDKSAADPYATRATSPTAPMADGGSTAPYATVAGPARTPQALVQAIGASTSSGLRFRILRPFAKGGLGEVLIAEDQELHREVALKQIQERYADDVESRNRFIAEAEITGALEHPGVVPVYGLGTYADGRPFYAMRFIRGDTFGDAIARFHKADVPGRDPGEREVALRQLLERFKDVCQAIAYAHSRGIIHRDLKPGNIMLGKYGETLVVDWGLAKPINQVETVKPPTGEHRIATTLTGTATVMGVAVGTPQFMSPEQAWGQLDRVGPPSDIYSLGATLYTLLVGVSPFEDRDINVVLDKVKKGDFPKPRSIKPAVHPALEAICLKAMALRPEDRYKTPLELVEDIDHWLADEPVSAWREPWRLRAARWLRRNKTKTTVAAAVILVATVSLGITNILLTAANERERQAKLKAEMNFRLAKSAVDDFHTKVSEEDLLLEPGMEALRQRLLGGASEFYAKFVEDRADDTTLQAELARAKFRLGLITGEIESEKTAIAKLEEARQIFEKEEDTYHTDLVRCYFQLGRLYRATDDLAESERMYQRAIARLKAKPSLSDEELAEL
ncbi:MAG: protein kinase, partial [Gemmataceae bacterium]|nr:protein kinase [Gemmataceae bacterium]